MIALLRGIVAATGLDHLVLDVQGVGYKVHAPAPLILRLSGSAEPTTLHVATIVREDALDLFGFATAQERDVFDTLRAVNKVGPKMALSVLSSLPLAALAQAVARDDVATLAKVHGVGKTTASRLCLELKNKLPETLFVAPSSGGEAVKVRPGDALPLALARLDYRKSEIDLVLNHADVPGPDDASVEERLRAALRVLAPRG